MSQGRPGGQPRGRVRGVALGLPPSGPGSIAPLGTRLGGLVLDWLVILPWLAVTYLLRHPQFVTTTRTNGTTYRHLVLDRPPAFVALLFLLPQALYTIGLIATRGRTLGEQWLGLRVVRVADLEPGADPNVAAVPRWGTSALRWIVIGWVSILSCFTAALTGVTVLVPVVVLGWAIWDSNTQGLHDKAAQVVVLRTR
jgi:uncharacterized RDD family membrane protein YckC